MKITSVLLAVLAWGLTCVASRTAEEIHHLHDTINLFPKIQKVILQGKTPFTVSVMSVEVRDALVYQIIYGSKHINHIFTTY